MWTWTEIQTTKPDKDVTQTQQSDNSTAICANYDVPQAQQGCTPNATIRKKQCNLLFFFRVGWDINLNGRDINHQFGETPHPNQDKFEDDQRAPQGCRRAPQFKKRFAICEPFVESGGTSLSTGGT